MKLLPQIQVEGGAEWLARTATQCLIDEAQLSPKPGLVDSRGNGAHHDLSLALMERSARSLTPTFQALAQHSWPRPADIALRQTIGRLGREGEQQMMAATDGVNTHRGAIWALGLLVSAVAMLGGEARAHDVARTAAQLAHIVIPHLHFLTNRQRASCRGPHVRQRICGVSKSRAYRTQRQRGDDGRHQRFLQLPEHNLCPVMWVCQFDRLGGVMFHFRASCEFSWR